MVGGVAFTSEVQKHAQEQLSTRREVQLQSLCFRDHDYTLSLDTIIMLTSSGTLNVDPFGGTKCLDQRVVLIQRHVSIATEQNQESDCTRSLDFREGFHYNGFPDCYLEPITAHLIQKVQSSYRLTPVSTAMC